MSLCSGLAGSLSLRRLLLAALQVSALLLAAGLPIAPDARGGGLTAGDLLITDANGARVLRVDPTTGVVSTFSPPVGGTNLLVRPAGIATLSDGSIFVADNTTNRLIRIDPATGVQTVALQPGSPLPGLLDIGSGPWGVSADPLDALYVVARESQTLSRVDPVGSGIYTATQVASNPTLAGARGIEASTTDVAVASESDGLGIFSLPAGTLNGFVGDPGPSLTVYDVVRIAGAMQFQTFDTLQATTLVLVGNVPFLLCDGAASGVGGKSGVEASLYVSGGSFRCPQALAAASDGSIYVTDAAAPFPSGGDARVIEVGPPGTWNTQSLVASIANAGAPTLPAGIAIMKKTVVPEPEPEAGFAAAVAGLLAGARRRARGGPSPR
jgi:hypothetical protein